MQEKSVVVLEEFEVTSSTMAIIGKGKVGQLGAYSIVLEYEGELVVNKKSLFIIDQSCKYFGSSLKGRQAGTKEVSGITHKQPIAIDPTSGIYMFPTISPLKDECVWISHTYVKEVRASGEKGSTIVFKNNRTIDVGVSKGSLNNQINKTAQFRFKLENRIKPKKMMWISPNTRNRSSK